MTRLKENDIETIVAKLEQYDVELVKMTGHTLSDIAAYAVGMHSTDFYDPGPIAVIPMTCGEGIIGGFSETVAGILRFLGMDVFVTSASDAQGFAEALEQKAEIIFIADDHQFIGCHLRTKIFSDNSEATGKGYVAALDYLAGGLKGQEVLILGAGPVGASAAFQVLDFGGSVHIFDKNPFAGKVLAEKLSSKSGQEAYLETDLDSALKAHHLILIACPEGNFIRKYHLSKETCIAAPGVPLGVHPEALEDIKQRLIHDPLQLGVATMLYEILSALRKEMR